MKILVSIFEVASVAVPLFIALLFLARSGESYREKYDVSKFRFWGFSRRQYVLFFRLVGVLFLLLACFAVYKNYIEEPSAEYNETKEFWDEINKRSGDVFSMAALLGAAIAIPARMASTRFPGKPLALLGGKAVIERVYQACKKSEFAEKTVILTDSIEIAEFADSISAPVVMTSEKCRSGGFVKLSRLEKGREEERLSRLLPDMVEKLGCSHSLGDICILTRNNEQAAKASSWLMARHIPVVTQGSLLLAEQPVIAGIVSLLAALLDWDWFFTARNTQFVVRNVGRRQARLFYGILGLILIATAVFFVLNTPPA